jgi:hypothetical protein
MALVFPTNPSVGQIFTGDNTVTYIYTGDRWSSAIAIHNGDYQYAYEGGTAFSVYNPLLDTVIDGGNA